MQGGLRQSVPSAAQPSRSCSGCIADVQEMFELDCAGCAAGNLFGWLAECRVVVAAIPAVCQGLHQCPSGMFTSLSLEMQS